MKKNVHPIVIAGLVITSLAFFGPASPWFLLGLIPLVTGLVGWCPPYSMLGIDTCKLGKGTR